MIEKKDIQNDSISYYHRQKALVKKKKILESLSIWRAELFISPKFYGSTKDSIFQRELSF